jgi:thiamine-monophosphate kinase
MDLKMLGEFGLIELFRKDWPPHPAQVVKGIGDDCAVIDTGGSALLLLTTDMLVEGIHFRLDTMTAYQLGVRSVAVNLSDIAAMGGEPTFSFMSVASPADREVAFMERFIQGYRDCSLKYGSRLLGGDTVSSPGPLVINVVQLGVASPGQVLYRNGAKEGDTILVSGPLGDSKAGLKLLLHPEVALPPEEKEYLLRRHLTPEPCIKLGGFLARSGVVTAAMDISDGISSDLTHICQESGVGAVIWAEKLPLSDSCRRTAELLKEDALSWALFGGEDFELLFTVSPHHVPHLAKAAEVELGVKLTEVGSVVKGEGVKLVEGGRIRDITGQGYRHFN